MLKNNKIKLILASALTMLPSIIGIIFWNKLPATLAIHWGVNGNADGFGSKAMAVFLLPLILLALFWLCVLITAKDPQNNGQNKKVFSMVIWIVPVISCLVNTMMYAATLYNQMPGTTILSLVLGLMFVVIGNYMPKCKQNSTIGIKISWTLKSEENWNATHRFAGKVWFIGGFLMLLCALLPQKLHVYITFIILVILIALPTAYSYGFYAKQKKDGTLKLADIPDSEFYKKGKKATLIFLPILLVFLVVVTFTGNIKIEYGETAFTVKADFYNDIKIDYDAVDNIEYLTDFDRGVRTSGFGSMRLLMGNFKNDEFGNYILYSYVKSGSQVVLTVDDKVLVLGGENEKATEDIYNKLTGFVVKEK